MEAVRLKVQAEQDGEIVLHDLSIHRNDRLEVILLKEEGIMQPRTTEAGDPVLRLQTWNNRGFYDTKRRA